MHPSYVLWVCTLYYTGKAHMFITMQKCLVQCPSLSEIVQPQRNLTYLDMTQAYETRAIQDVRYTLAFRTD